MADIVEREVQYINWGRDLNRYFCTPNGRMYELAFNDVLLAMIRRGVKVIDFETDLEVTEQKVCTWMTWTTKNN
jgi:hypothetical protein